MPGRSVTSVSECPLMGPSLRSTVTPGKLPTCWLDPVSWLNSVVLPQFWLPASANVIVVPSGSGVSVALSWKRAPPSPKPGWLSGADARRALRSSPASRTSDTSIRAASSRRSVSS